MKRFRMVYAVMAWLFVVGVAVQVFFAGMAVVARQWPWSNHINLGSVDIYRNQIRVAAK